MPKFTVEHTSPLSANETFQKVREFLDNDQDLRKMDSSYKCDFNEANLTGSAKGSQFKANLKVQEQSSGAHVLIEVDLPLMLSPFKGVVRSTLEKKMQKLLG